MAEVKKVKRFKNGFITDPFTLNPDNTLNELLDIKEKYGYTSFPITEDGAIGSKLLGIVTTGDFSFVEDNTLKMKDLMTTDLIVGTSPLSIEEANKLLYESRKGVLPIVDDNYNLVAMISRKDLHKNSEFPLITKNENKQLKVGVAVSTRYLEFN